MQGVAVSLRLQGQLPELWNAETGDISHVNHWDVQQGRTWVYLHLQPHQSRFVVLRRPATAEELAQGSHPRPALQVTERRVLSGGWDVHFAPKLDSAFSIRMDSLQDFSLSRDPRISYFAGTATYTSIVKLKSKDLQPEGQVWLDLGEMNDIAELTVNGQKVGVLWYPPYRIDITKYLRKNKNTLSIAVTNNWANRLIGDEQYPADFEWGKDRGKEMGRAMKAYPEWFLKGQPRPQQGRKCFNVWYYYRKGDALQKAGLDGPVVLEFQK